MLPPPPEFVTFGGLRIDYLITAAGEVGLRCCGGNALFSAVGAAIWGRRVGVVGRVGQNYPTEWLAEAESGGLDLRGVRRLPETVEMRTFFAHQPDNARAESDPAAHFARLGLPLPDDLATYTQPSADQTLSVYAPLSIQPDDLPAAYHTALGYHLAPMDYAGQLALAQHVRALGAPLLTLDCGLAYMRPGRVAAVAALLRHVDVFLPSDTEVEGLLGKVPAEDAARRFAAWGPHIVVIKQGAAGCLVYDADTDRATHVPACPARVRDVTGAGDAFCGGFLVGYAETADPILAARRGAVSASFAIEDFGALHPLRYARPAALPRLLP